MKNLTDRELVDLFQSGKDEEGVFRQLMTRYQERLYWLIRRFLQTHEDTDDVLQNTFVKIWKGMPSFRSDSELYTWMYRIAVNEAISFRKQNLKQQNISAGEAGDYLVSRAQADPWYDGDKLYDRLIRAVEQLPERQRQIFQLKYFEDLKYEEISKILNTSVGALKASYHHAVKKIQQSISKED